MPRGDRPLPRRSRPRSLPSYEGDDDVDDSSSNASFLSTRWLRWGGLALAAFVWTLVLLVNSQHLRETTSSDPLSVAGLDPEVLLRPWRDRVGTLETNLAEMRQELARRDDVLAKLKRQLTEDAAAMGSANSAAVSAGAAAAAAPAPDLPGLGPSDAAPALGAAAISMFGGDIPSSEGPLPGKQSGQGVGSAAGAPLLSRLRGPGPGLVASVPGVVPVDTSKCLFQDNIDYQSIGREDVIEHISAEKCCELCAERNKQRPGSCAVGVLSSSTDSPPHACWLKERVRSAVRKEGVRACWPPGHGEIPPDPDAEAKAQLQARLATFGLAGSSGPPDRAALLKRAEAIRGAMRHAWSSYRRLAWGRDELKPVSGSGVDNKFNHAVTMVDSLDTLWIMGLKEEFNEARAWIAEHLGGRLGSLGGGTSVFETTIRSLGGLLSAFDLSKDRLFLDLATQLGQRIKSVVSEQGITPYTFSGGVGGMGCPSLAESGTIQLEMRYLSHVTGDPSFAEKVDRFYDTVQRHRSFDGLWPNCFSSGRGKITFGADGDSFYEYLLKAWLQNDRKEDRLWQMYDAAASGLEKHLVKVGSDGLTYLGNIMWGGSDHDVRYQEEMEHLTCFVPGWLALGAKDERGAASRERRIHLAESIANTCWQMYDQQPTGIGPERVKFMKMDLSSTDTREYILRPEAAEGWWYMHELMGDPRYREWGWKTFLKFEEWLWVNNGYASLKDVRSTQKIYIDRMESFFLAETLKYLFLLQDPDHTIKLDRYVFNTEAHPLSILKYATAS